MNRKLYLTVIIIIAISLNIIAQSPNGKKNKPVDGFSGKISGSLFDAQTNQIIEYGNIVLYNHQDSVMVTGTITKKEGNFILENVQQGRYFLKISFIGYSTKIIDSIRVNPKSPEVKLGRILLDEESIELCSVIVTGEKETIINNLDKKIINVEKDLTSTGGSAVDVVQNIPSVTVDLDGNISFRGNQNVTILVDGKPSAMIGASNSDILNSIPASSIESIELVTNPSARYDPDGTSGIMNIILKKRIDGGLNGSMSANVGTGDKYNGSINLNYRTPYFNFFSAFDSRIARNDNESNSLRTSEIQNSTSYLSQTGSGYNDHSSYNANAGLDYLYDDFNTFTFTYNYRKGGFDNVGKTSSTSLNSQNEITDYFEQSNIADRNMRSNNYTLSYRRTSKINGEELTADIIYGNNKMNRDEAISQNNFNTDLTPTSEPPYLQKGLSSNKNKQWTFQTNYINPIDGFGRIETGAKVSLKDLNSKNDYQNYDYGTLSWINDPLRKTDFDYKEQIYAAYGIYSGNLNKFQYQLGLRAEQANVDGSELTTITSFNKNYFALYPTVHLQQVLRDDQEVMLSYSRRVDRPNNRELNPYVDKSDSLNIQYGNPQLDPEFENSFELGYSKFFNKTSLTSSLFYKLTDDVISTYTILREDGVSETTWRNIAESTTYGVELTGVHPLFDWLKLNGSFSYFHSQFEEEELFNEDNSWIAKLNTNFMLSKDFNFQINFNYNSPIVTPQGREEEVFTTDFAVKKDFMEGRLSLTFRISDVFNTRDMNSETYGENFFTTSYRKRESRVAFLGISFRLNPGNSNKDKERKPNGEDGMDDF